MSNVENTGDILVLRPTGEDLIAGARYAAVTLPWTFNRMMYNRASRGLQNRGLNIAKGIVAQEVLKRELGRLNIKAQTQRKSHRDEDLFDFTIETPSGQFMLDLKSWHYYTDYNSLGRESLSPDLIITAAHNPGPDWRTFFPMLIPHTQIRQAKEAYCFAIASSIDIRNDLTSGRSGYHLTAYPYGELRPFLSCKRLCVEREAEGAGIHLRLSWNPGLLDPKILKITMLAERDGHLASIPLRLPAGDETRIGPISCLECFQIEKEEYDRWVDGAFSLAVTQNELNRPVLNTARRNINTLPAGELVLRRDDFCNLMLPDDYCLYFIGWITKDDFLNACRQYTGWIWPNDKENRYQNQPWSRITESDLRSLNRTGFADCILSKPTRLAAGWLKTTGRGGGACCYVYPNIGARGGVKETNLYVLPCDLQTMATLGSQ